jgi:hypothetical protein
MKTPPELDAIAKVVLDYRPKPKSVAAKKRVRKAKRNAKKLEMSTWKLTPKGVVVRTRGVDEDGN